MGHFVYMQIFHRHEPRSILWPGGGAAISQSVSQSVSQSDSEVGTTAGGVARARGSGRARGLVRIARSGS